MSGTVRLVLTIHNHQPVGNFDGVFEDAYNDSYTPFLDVLDQFPGIPISLHVSGSLMEWLVKAHPEYIERLRQSIDKGQIEILGGPFYEPILSCIPGRDRVGQIRAYTEYLNDLFNTDVKGMWVPERVWEQSFSGDITEAGIEYTILDDYHFQNAGLTPDQLNGYFLSEDEGRLLKIFPGSEKLRYTIPFADPHETINYLREIGERHHNPVIAFGDDGEKFGTWPETKKHVYDDGWLHRFFSALKENSDWLKVVTLKDAVEQTAPVGSCYLPDCSYREMTEWSLTTDRQMVYQNLVHRKEHDPDWEELKQFIKGGFWRNFRIKYPESNEMYSRMLEVSQRLEKLEQSRTFQNRTEEIQEAKLELYRAQCNCSYWHGAFGGLYLPHLRNAVYSCLISADNMIEKMENRPDRWVDIQADDFNHDARKEIRLAGNRLIAYISPSKGGHIYELDVRLAKHNLLATLNRRPEPYHEKVRNAASYQQDNQNSDNATSIHDLVKFKQPDLDKKLVYDNWPRKSLVDHFIQPGLSMGEFQASHGGLGDFTEGVYESKLRRSDERVELIMSRTGNVGSYQVQVEKIVALDTKKAGQLEIHYQISNLPTGFPIHFGIEFNFAGLAAGQDDRYYYNDQGQQLGQLDTVHALDDCKRIGLVDEWLGLDTSLDFSKPTDIWTFPIQTISQSEGGFELVHQSCAVIPHWEFIAPDSGQWDVSIQLEVDTSAAQARQLRESAAIS